MFRKLLATYENIATFLYRFELPIALISVIMLIVGVWFGFEDINKKVGMWLALTGTWGIGAVIFSNIYSLKEERYIDGKYIPSSEVRNANSWMGYYGLIFTTVWIFVGLLLTIVVLLKTIE